MFIYGFILAVVAIGLQAWWRISYPGTPANLPVHESSFLSANDKKNSTTISSKARNWVRKIHVLLFLVKRHLWLQASTGCLLGWDKPRLIIYNASIWTGEQQVHFPLHSAIVVEPQWTSQTCSSLPAVLLIPCRSRSPRSLRQWLLTMSKLLLGVFLRNNRSNHYFMSHTLCKNIHLCHYRLMLPQCPSLPMAQLPASTQIHSRESLKRLERVVLQLLTCEAAISYQ